jgi:hypothetical protein
MTNRIYIARNGEVYFHGKPQITSITTSQGVYRLTEISLELSYDPKDVIWCDTIEQVKAELI